MMQTTGSQRPYLLLFVGMVVSVYAVALTIIARLPGLDGADAVAFGLTVDLVVVVPAAFYLLVIRRRRKPFITIAPVVILSLVATSLMLPPAHQKTLHVLELAVFPLEIGLIGWIGWRTVKAVRAARRDQGLDPLEQLRSAALGLLQNERAAGIFASEIGVLYYALGSWRARPHVPDGMSAFTHHLRCGQAGLVFGFLVLLAAEGFGVHLLLMKWNPVVAWIFTAGTVYGALWMVADLRATIQRPILVGPDSVVFRSGLRWTVEVPRDQIVALGSEQPASGTTRLNLKLMGSPTRWVTLSEPMPARGLYGARKMVTAIGCEPDSTEEFIRAVAIPSV